MSDSSLIDRLLSDIKAHRLIERVENRILLSRLSELSQTIERQPAEADTASPLEPLLADQTAETVLFPSNDSHAAWQSCQELRLQLAVALLSIYALKDGPQKPRLTDVEGDRTPIKKAAGGIVYMEIQDHTVIAMPQPLSAKHIEMIIDGLFYVSRTARRDAHWLIDLSAVKDLQFKLFFTLVGHWDTLASNGRSIHLAWVSDGILPPFVFDQMVSIFSLTNRLGHWFSRFRAAMN